ncbi:hypothetical protein AcetOrient_orf00302p (plasmid) [Acetobacter orientalis]|uniref:Uncharacterized protein n=1 Tax=Acetobacter orientalis TaxID=146474 RepID=A0A2Z5ZN18_9PROT|nr:hypothetical protein AcetOrient_orf00302p [Acetobacter orientalis]
MTKTIKPYQSDEFDRQSQRFVVPLYIKMRLENIASLQLALS